MPFYPDFRLFPSISTCGDHRSKQSNLFTVKFQRAFEFLQLLLFYRVYGIDARTFPAKRRAPTSFDEHSNCCEVFLGGPCNLTTWRHEHAIPHFQSHFVSFYNPQDDDWTPELVQIEHQAKESAALLFFVIDHDTRSLAAIAEVCYLAARRRKIVVVINPMPDDQRETKFFQQKSCVDDRDNQHDYNNVCHARRTLRILLRSLNVPVFDQIRIALEYATFVLNISKCPLIVDSEQLERRTSDSKTRYEKLSSIVHSPEFTPLCNLLFRNRAPLSTCTNESDDDGYVSLLTIDRARSHSSSSSIESESPAELSVNSISPTKHKYLLTSTRSLSQKIISILPRGSFTFDLYIASSEFDRFWLDTVAVPVLDDLNIFYTKRSTVSDDEQLDTLYDFHIRQQAHLLYYLINGHERLSDLTTELAFLIGERKHHIIVYLEPKIAEDCSQIMTKSERLDLERSRKYLQDLAEKEEILVCSSREQSWRHVLAFFVQDE